MKQSTFILTNKTTDYFGITITLMVLLVSMSMLVWPDSIKFWMTLLKICPSHKRLSWINTHRI